MSRIATTLLGTLLLASHAFSPARQLRPSTRLRAAAVADWPAGAKKAGMAEAGVAERATGYVVGGISPLGQKQRLATFIDASAEALERLHVSAGRRGLEISLATADLVRFSAARYAELAR